MQSKICNLQIWWFEVDIMKRTYFIWLNLGLRAPAFNMQTMSTEHLLWSEMILMSAANLIKGHSEGGEGD